MEFLSVRDLSAVYPTSKGNVLALDNVNFSLNKGESVGIAGESACGKSTLGLALIRMLQGGKITSGKIKFEGELVLDLTESAFDKNYRWKKISMVFQGAMNSLDPVFTIEEQFKEVLKQHKFKGDYSKTIHDAMASVNLDESVLKKYPHELSGGMKQRIVIAIALLLKPDFVIADEPTTALDVLIQAQIINLLKQMKKDGMSMMMISHDLAILSEISDKIGVMYGGQIVEFGTAQEVYKNPKHPYTQGLLASIPTLHGKKPSFIPGNPPSLLEPESRCRFIDRCPKAMEKCKKDPPNFNRETGYVKCWLYE
ncbi:MAG: ATP-binding cassette domain-containing protein [Nitrosopumilaceae archaeon]|nr:ABC transporter ATP-binding protein [Nitrosopumilaceae archaeon]NIU00586.1 ABC transporter ATP-binding protein [Nitrosopumilaceae archaeon]NIU86972.1 ATP-binding cassette domain-containing protein [Nitrosopumilaceae archaeon]NIV66436.1 ATP-binding cassette domain-containing protein [Nitrosopumilaceae archaeon]NIX61188.1 ATP-binding cassette domain-containing protein [Nitrosopumilaceae archaeon]